MSQRSTIQRYAISMTDLPWLDPDEHRVFIAYVHSTRRLAVQFDQDLQNSVGMPRTYFEILWLLNKAPEHSMRMSELAERTLSQSSRISHAVGRLEEAGQVRRVLCTADRRGWFAVLTDDGLAALQKAAPRYAQSIREHLLAPLSATQREALAQISETVLHQLDLSNESALSQADSEPADTSPKQSQRARITPSGWPR